MLQSTAGASCTKLVIEERDVALPRLVTTEHGIAGMFLGRMHRERDARRGRDQRAIDKELGLVAHMDDAMQAGAG